MRYPTGGGGHHSAGGRFAFVLATLTHPPDRGAVTVRVTGDGPFFRGALCRVWGYRHHLHGPGPGRARSRFEFGGTTTMTTVDQAGVGRLQVFVNDKVGLTHVMLTGELDLATAPLLAEMLRGIDPHDCDLVIDVALLTFVDSVGLGILAAEHNRLQAHGRRLTIYAPTPALRRLFQITGLDKVLAVEG